MTIDTQPDLGYKEWTCEQETLSELYMVRDGDYLFVCSGLTKEHANLIVESVNKQLEADAHPFAYSREKDAEIRERARKTVEHMSLAPTARELKRLGAHSLAATNSISAVLRLLNDRLPIVELDRFATVSKGDDGHALVMAWLRVKVDA